MSRKVNELLMKLSLIEPTMPEFITVSKEIAEAYKEYSKKKLEPKPPKVKKEKPKRTVLCEDCSKILLGRLNEIVTLPEKKVEL
jgi:hypothetical protein